MAKILTIRLPDEHAAFLASFAANSRLSVNRSLDAIVEAAMARGWTELALIPSVAATTNSELSRISES